MCFFGEVFVAGEVVKGVLPHLVDVGYGEVAVVIDHVGVDVVFVNNPGVSFNGKWWLAVCFGVACRFLAWLYLLWWAGAAW